MGEPAASCSFPPQTKLVVTAVASAMLPRDWPVSPILYPTDHHSGSCRRPVLPARAIRFGSALAPPTRAKGACETDSFPAAAELAAGLRARGFAKFTRPRRRRELF